LQEYYFIEPTNYIISKVNIASQQPITILPWIPGFIYAVGVCYHLIRLINTVLKITKQEIKADKVSLGSSLLVLVNQKILPHSFLNKIYLNKEEYTSGIIEKEIIEHELTHVRQKHSIDIILAKLVQSIFWFNPFYTLILKTLQLNHEFLADNSAAKASGNEVTYQQLLLQKVTNANYISISSPFNYLTIKKRLAMIQTQTPLQTQLFKKAVTICFAFAIVFLFINKETIAQTKPAKNNETTVVPSTKEGASRQQLKEYADIIDRYKKYTDSNRSINLAVTKEEKDRLLAIYLQMTEAQKQEQKYGFMPKPPTKIAKTVTEDDLDKWESSDYFVRINGYKVKNNSLFTKKASDLLLFDYYVPNKGSTDYGKYKAQVNLSTKEDYEKYKKSWNEMDQYILVTFAKRLKN